MTRWKSCNFTEWKTCLGKEASKKEYPMAQSARKKQRFGWNEDCISFYSFKNHQKSIPIIWKTWMAFWIDPEVSSPAHNCQLTEAMMDPLIHGKWIFRLLNCNSSDQLRSLLNHWIHPWSPKCAAGGIMTASWRWLTNIQFWPHSATWKPWCLTKKFWQNDAKNRRRWLHWTPIV